MIYPGRNPDQMRSSNRPWFRLDMAPEYHHLEESELVMGGSAIDAPEFLPSGSTTTSPTLRPYTVLVREVARES